MERCRDEWMATSSKESSSSSSSSGSNPADSASSNANISLPAYFASQIQQHIVVVL